MTGGNRRRFRVFLLIGGIASLCLPFPSFAVEQDWTFEFFIGFPFHFSSPLTIRQSGQPDVTFQARYETKPFERPIYYGGRIGHWRDDNGWELEFIHSKLYLVNKPEDVQVFSLSHGFNLLTLNRSWERGGVVERLGAGVVIAHPESTVRGRRFPEDGGILNRGYFLAGPTAQASFGKQFRIAGECFAPVEGKFNASFARVPIADGDADVTNIAIQGVFGLGAGR